MDELIVLLLHVTIASEPARFNYCCLCRLRPSARIMRTPSTTAHSSRDCNYDLAPRSLTRNTFVALESLLSAQSGVNSEDKRTLIAAFIEYSESLGNLLYSPFSIHFATSLAIAPSGNRARSLYLRGTPPSATGNSLLLTIGPAPTPPTIVINIPSLSMYLADLWNSSSLPTQSNMRLMGFDSKVSVRWAGRDS